MVGDAFALHLVREVGVQIVEALAIDRQFVDVIIGNGVSNGLVGGRTLIRLLDLLQHLWRDASICLLRLCG